MKVKKKKVFTDLRRDEDGRSKIRAALKKKGGKIRHNGKVYRLKKIGRKR